MKGLVRLAGVGMWERVLVARWVVHAQLVAVTVLGMAAVMPFVMVPAIVAVVATLVIVGPRGLVRLAQRREGRSAE